MTRKPSRDRKNLTVFWVAAMGGMLLTLACRVTPTPTVPLIVGSVAPEFSLPALGGDVITLRSLAGKTVILNFWATWCTPCRREIPELIALAKEGAVEVVGVALDREGARTVEPFVEQFDIPYTVLLGDQGVFERFQGFSIPYTLVLDPSQRIIGIYRGPVTRSTIAEARLAAGRAAS